MSTHYLLIHGAWQGAWIWAEIARQVEAAGHGVTVMDLPGSGDDLTPAGDVTLASYSQAIQAKALDIGSKDLVLVGHSMGGAAITQAASDAPELFARLIYVCAFVPRTGENVVSLARRSHELNAGGPAPLPNAEKTAASLTPENIVESLLNGCSEEIIQWALPQFRPQPLGPLTGLVTRSAGFDKLPKRYVLCLQDRAIAPELQSEMAASADIADVREMNSGHEPFFSAPDTLRLHLS